MLIMIDCFLLEHWLCSVWWRVREISVSSQEIIRQPTPCKRRDSHHLTTERTLILHVISSVPWMSSEELGGHLWLTSVTVSHLLSDDQNADGHVGDRWTVLDELRRRLLFTCWAQSVRLVLHAGLGFIFSFMWSADHHNETAAVFLMFNIHLFSAAVFGSRLVTIVTGCLSHTCPAKQTYKHEVMHAEVLNHL